MENARSCLAGLDLAIFLISRRWPSVNFAGRPPLYFGCSEPNSTICARRQATTDRWPDG